MMMLNKNNIGGGTGGGAGMDDDGNNLQSAKSTYQIAGNQVVLLSRKPAPPDNAGPSVITILAGGGPPTFDDDGKVDVRGSRGVRITAGPPRMLYPLTSPPVTDPKTSGVEIVVWEGQSITIQRGCIPGDLYQKIEMTPDNKITLDAGSIGSVTIKAGVNSITVDAKTGITIQGLPFVKIN